MMDAACSARASSARTVTSARHRRTASAYTCASSSGTPDARQAANQSPATAPTPAPASVAANGPAATIGPDARDREPHQADDQNRQRRQ